MQPVFRLYRPADFPPGWVAPPYWIKDTMTELCKHQVKDKEKSGWNSTVYRNCKLEAKRDGYCDLHHPENIALAVERSAHSELIEDLRVAQRQEESMVGAYMRLRRKEEFEAIIVEIKNAEELASEIRGRRR